MDRKNLKDWLKQQGFILMNSYTSSEEYEYTETVDIYDKKLISDSYLSADGLGLFLTLRAQLESNSNGNGNSASVFLMLNSSASQIFTSKRLMGVDTVDRLKSLIDDVVETGRRLMEKGFGRLSEYRMTGM